MSEPNSSVTRRVLHRGVKFDFEELTWTGRGGRAITRQVVRHPGAVVILPILEGASAGAGSGGAASGGGASGGGSQTGPDLLLVRNHRHAVGRTLLELPAGTREPGEDPALTAARELEEETGHRCASVELLVSFYTTPGMTDELMHAFVARGLEPTSARPEEDEQLEAVRMSLSAVLRAIDAGAIVDAKTILTVLHAQRRGVLPAG